MQGIGPGETTAFVDAWPWRGIRLWLAAGLLAIVAACLLFPEVAYDRYVWRYLWGPIVAEAAGLPPGVPLFRNGIATFAGYNAVNTLAWALLFVVGFLALWRWLRVHALVLEGAWLAGLAGWAVAGCIWHVVQDAGILPLPLAYLMITPLVYVVFGVAGFASVRWAIGRGAANPQARIVIVHASWASLAGLVLLASWWATQPHAPLQLGALGAPVLAALVALAFVASSRHRGSVDLRRPALIAFVFFEALDAFVTGIGLDLYGHVEKHALPSAFIDAASTAFARLGWDRAAAHAVWFSFVPVKLAVTLAVAFGLRGRFRRHVADAPVFFGLVFYLLILDGLGPGLRGFLRLFLAV